MPSLMAGDEASPTDTRARLLGVAVALISQNGFAGTSLQMIADELGFTRAAIYYHFRTREQLLIALMEPILEQICGVVDAAENQRTARTQMDAMVQGFARVVVKHRSLAAVMVFDPSVHRVLQLQPDWGDLIGRQLAILMQLDSGPTGVIKATALMTGMAGAATGAPADVDEHALVIELADIGRRIMGLPKPRRQNGDGQGGTDSRAPKRPDTDPGRWKDFLTEA